MPNKKIQSQVTWFQTCLSNKKLVSSLQTINLVICDVDGTLTNAHIFLPSANDEIKGFSVQDGFGIARSIKAGINIAFLSGRASDMVALRAKRLGIPAELCALGIDNNKMAIVRNMQSFSNTSKEKTLFIGDDMLDIEARNACSLFAAPHNSPFYIQSIANIVIPADGGHGAVRLMLDLILYTQQRHFAQELITQALASL